MKLNPELDVWSKSVPMWEQGQQGGRTRPIDREILYTNLVEVCKLLEKYKIKYWVSHGTALGFYRDGNFIEWDDDADISVEMSDKHKELAFASELRTLGYYVPPQGDPTKPIDPYKNMPYADTVAIKDGEKIEIWWWTRADNRYTYDELRPPCELNHDAKFYDTLSSIKIRDYEFPIPYHTEEWLELMYGKNWGTPLKDKKYNTQR